MAEDGDVSGPEVPDRAGKSAWLADIVSKYEVRALLSFQCKFFFGGVSASVDVYPLRDMGPLICCDGEIEVERGGCTGIHA